MTLRVKQRRSTKERAGPKVWLAAIALVSALFVIGDSSPLRHWRRRCRRLSPASLLASDMLAPSGLSTGGNGLPHCFEAGDDLTLLICAVAIRGAMRAQNLTPSFWPAKIAFLHVRAIGWIRFPTR